MAAEFDLGRTHRIAGGNGGPGKAFGRLQSKSAAQKPAAMASVKARSLINDSPRLRRVITCQHFELAAERGSLQNVEEGLALPADSVVRLRMTRS